MNKRLATHVLLCLLASLLAMSSAFAQNTSAAMSGRVTDASGKPVAGATVRIVHVPSGTASVTTTDANGRYIAQGLRVGGPYHVEAQGNGIKDIGVDNVYLELGQVATTNLAEAAVAATQLKSVTVTANALDSTFNADNKGVGTNVSGRALETAVSGNRSLDDIARLDPRITVVDQSDGSISLAGQNNRYNNISVDGLAVTDPFGLNSNGLAFTGSPISPDTIAAYEIKATDYDTAFDSVGANINAVTKSGTNEFHGSVYGAYTDASSMVGDRGGADYAAFDKNKTWGVTLGGPIIKDKLFFFAAYEDQKITGLAGAGTDAVTSGNLSQAQVDAVGQAFKSIGIDTGGGSGSSGGLTQEDKRSLVKLDWNINDSQRATFTYQQTKESKPTPYNSYVSAYHYLFLSNWYTVANKTNNYSLQLFSDWSDNFSTEFKLGYQKFDNTNGASEDQPEVFACFTASASACAANASANPFSAPFRSIGSTVPAVIAGEDWYRAENAINSKRLNGTWAGTWHLGDHVVKAGFDYLSNKVADVFGLGLHGSYGFYDANGDGSPIDEILAGDYVVFKKTYLPEGVSLADVAGTWKYTQISPFLQDTWQATDRFSLTYGVRIDIPKADHAPPVAIDSATGQSYWQEAFGYAPNTKLGSKNKVIEPRVAFNYQFDTQLRMQLRGGIGLFQTVPPYVWLTNPYSNNGVTSLIGYRGNDPATQPFSSDPYNQPGPTSAPSGNCTNRGCSIDTLAPDFKLPTALKLSLGYDTELPWWGLTASVEDMLIKAHDAIAYIEPNIGVPVGTLPDGRLRFSSHTGSDPDISTGATELTNTSQGFSNALTFSLSKPWDNGLSGTISATFTHATDVNPGSASQASSNFTYYSRTNPNDIVSANSRFNIPLSFKAALNWEHAFFGDNRTTASVFYNGHSGRPYSWVFGNDANGDGLPSGTDLAYIPLVNDPLVSYGSATQAQIDAFNAFIDHDSYLSKHRGQIASRNVSNSPWVNQLDVGLQQELPGFFGKDKFVVRMDIFNFLNLLNKKWGDVEDAGYFGTRTLATTTLNADGTQYVYDISKPPTKYTLEDASVARVISRWQILLTLTYKF
ncbi:MAG: TonB-dependent receptor [Rudaea sp.]